MEELITLLRSREFEIYDITEPTREQEKIMRCVGKDPAIGYCEIDIFPKTSIFKITKMLGDVRLGYAHSVRKDDIKYLGADQVLAECTGKIKDKIKMQ